MFILGTGSKIFEAVVIAALSALFAKTIEVAAEEIKEKRKKNKEQRENKPSLTR